MTPLLNISDLSVQFVNDGRETPDELSGGQCQRAAIARAVLMQPKLVICDEAASALDVSVLSQVIALLQSLQVELNLSLLFISHDLSVVRPLSDRVLVLYSGRLMELGSSAEVLDLITHSIPTPAFYLRPCCRETPDSVVR